MQPERNPAGQLDVAETSLREALEASFRIDARIGGCLPRRVRGDRRRARSAARGRTYRGARDAAAGGARLGPRG